MPPVLAVTVAVEVAPPCEVDEAVAVAVVAVLPPAPPLETLELVVVEDSVELLVVVEPLPFDESSEHPANVRVLPTSTNKERFTMGKHSRKCGDAPP